MTNQARSFKGVILGTAVGDAIGLPREGLSRRRVMRIFGGSPLRHRLVFGRGMISDDTEHTCMTAQALLASRGDPELFARSLGWRLRGWFIALPAGIGMATAKACLKLWMGFGQARSGVWSAGNGPAMRAAILGVYAAGNLERLRALVKASTRLTHVDPAAEHGALAVALAAAYAEHQQGSDVVGEGYLTFIRKDLSGTEMFKLIEAVVRAVAAGDEIESFFAAHGLSNGVSGYINHTVPSCIFVWLKYPRDFRAAVEHIVLTGGDTDTTGAIVGALTGITAGPESIPTEWLDGISEWPRSVDWMNRLALSLAQDEAKPVALFWPALLLRNIAFLLIVLLHGVRRLFPPY
jgi:ADP-ribosylglycohydrolase